MADMKVINDNLSNEEKIRISLDNIQNKRNKIYFFVPDIAGAPSGAVYEIYFHAALLKSLGYDAKILVETAKSKKPDYIESELLNGLEHIPMENARLTASPEDMLIIPEIFTNVMEQTKNLPSIRVVLLQSVDNALRALVPGTSWANFGIKDVITTSEMTKSFVEEFFGNGTFNIRKYNVSVPDYFTKGDTNIKRPVVSVFVRNEAELEKVIKLFYTKFPHFSWITFEAMQTDSKPPKFLRRKDFADKLSKNFAALWIDRLSTHAQFPLECMKVGTVPIALKPDITPDYILDEGKYINNSGVWTSDLYALPSLIADTLRMFLDDGIPQDMFDTMDKIVSNFTPDIAKKQLTEIYEGLINERRDLFQKTLDSMTPKVSEPVEGQALTDQILSQQ